MQWQEQVLAAVFLWVASTVAHGVIGAELMGGGSSGSPPTQGTHGREDSDRPEDITRWSPIEELKSALQDALARKESAQPSPRRLKNVLAILEEEGDVSVHRLTGLLSPFLDSSDAGSIPVKEAYRRFRQLHFLRAFDPGKPVILFLHGSGDSPFKRFETLFGQLEEHYNLAVFGYDNYDKVEAIAADLNEQWQAAVTRCTIRPPFGIVTHSYGNVVLRMAVARAPRLYEGGCVMEIVPPWGGAKPLSWMRGPMSRTVFKLILGRKYNLVEGAHPNEKVQRMLSGDEAVDTFNQAFRGRRLAIAGAGDVNNPRSRRMIPPGKSRLRKHYEKMQAGSRFVLLEDAQHARAPEDSRIVEAAEKFFKEVLAAPSSGTGPSP
jgi:pimeloyl-ACP methyl ester carboxylesterase